MKSKDLISGMSFVDERFVNEAETTMLASTSQIKWKRWGTIAACFVLMVTAMFVGLPNLNDNPTTITPLDNLQEDVLSNSSTEDKTDDLQQVTPQIPQNINIAVNEVNNPLSADIDVQISFYNELSDIEWDNAISEFQKVMGIAYGDFTARIPSTFTVMSFYSFDTPGDTSRTEYYPHDYVFECQTENGGQVTIALCSFDNPLRDWFIKCENPEQSEINGVPIIIYGYENSFVAEFSFENVNYDIGTNNITLEELKTLLINILDVAPTSD